MVVKAIFSECNMPFWVEVAHKLSESASWNVQYWIASPEMEVPVREKFPKAVFHVNDEAIRGVGAPECVNIQLIALDQTLLGEMAYAESIALRMMDRMDPGDAFSHPERVRLYHRNLQYWLSVILRYQPDIVVFPTSPHAIYDYVLYALCQRLNIKTIMFEHTPLSSLLIPMTRFEEETAVGQLYQQLQEDTKNRNVLISPDAEEYIAQIEGEYSQALPSYMRRLHPGSSGLGLMGAVAYLREGKLDVGKALGYPTEAMRSLVGQFNRSQTSAPTNYLKLNGKKLEDSYMTGMEFKRYKSQAAKYKKTLKAHYDGLTEGVDLDKPYIYVALNYQPERTTSPNGAVFVDQFLMIDMLSRCILNDWSLYVKVHPSQFHPKLHSECSANEFFYDDIAALPNATLVSESLSSFDLIDKSQAVATVTSTAGWEAVIRGKPAFVFGHPWYKGCEGVFYTATRMACANALKAIQEGFKVERWKVRLFLHALEQVCIKGYTQQNDADLELVTHAENINNMTRVLRTFPWGDAVAMTEEKEPEVAV